jgi:tripartite-type tricarboxylate transporter receptor subunit TctC
MIVQSIKAFAHGLAALAVALVLGGGTAQAEWPEKPVRIIVPFAAGSTPDAVARVMAEGLQAEIPGSTFVVENKPGASGNLGTEAVAKADPDGATMGLSIGGPLAINTLLFANLKYDPRKEIAAVSQLVTQASILAVHKSVGVKTVAELVTALKADPQKFTYGSIGAGSLSHLAMEAIAQKAGVKLVHLPMQGSPAAMTALLRGDVQVACLPSIAVSQHANSGDIVILAVTTPERSPFLPAVPTLKESGIAVEADAWNGFIAPAGVAPDVLARMHAMTVKVLSHPEVRGKLEAQQMVPVGSSPAQFRALIDAEIARWAPVIQAAGIKIN